MLTEIFNFAVDRATKNVIKSPELVYPSTPPPSPRGTASPNVFREDNLVHINVILRTPRHQGHNVSVVNYCKFYYIYISCVGEFSLMVWVEFLGRYLYLHIPIHNAETYCKSNFKEILFCIFLISFFFSEIKIPPLDTCIFLKF